MTRGADADRLEFRLAELERSNRRLRTTSGVALVCALAFPCLAFTAPFFRDEVRARSFVLVDGNDLPRASLRLETGGTPSFEMTDSEGKRRIDISVKGVEPSVLLLSADEKSRLGFAVDGDGLPHGVFYDPLRRPRLHLVVDREGLGSLSMIGEKGTIDAGLGIDQKSGPWLLPKGSEPAATTAGEAGKLPAPSDPSPDTRK